MIGTSPRVLRLRPWAGTMKRGKSDAALILNQSFLTKVHDVSDISDSSRSSKIGESMSAETCASPEALIRLAKQGETSALGQLLTSYHNYLTLLASTQLNVRLQARISPSDIVQETFLQAHKAFGQFRGTTEAELLVWLRRILATRLAKMVEKNIIAGKRDVRREISLDDIGRTLDRSTARLEAVLAADQSTPSTRASRHEHAVLLADELADLPDDYREVLMLRDLEGLPFSDVAERMGRTSGAVRMLWFRAIDKLRRQLAEKGLI